MTERTQAAVEKIMRDAGANAPVDKITRLAIQGCADIRRLGLNECDRLTLAMLLLAGTMKDTLPERNWRPFVDNLPRILMNTCMRLSGKRP